MPLITKKASDVKLDVWIIHTFRPHYRIMKAELDPETKVLLDARKTGTLEETPSAKQFSRKQFAAESLEHTPERAENQLWAQADEHGDFILENGSDAYLVWEAVKRDPEPKATLDPRSPEIPKPTKEAPKAKA